MATEKQEKLHDFTVETDALIKQIDAKYNKDNLNDCIYELLSLEKKTRLSVDIPNTIKVSSKVIEICYKTKQYAALTDNLIILMKRRAQIQKVQESLIKQTMSYINEIDDSAVKKDLCEKVRDITDGKLFVEIERARATRYVSNYIEVKENNIVRACELIQDIQVETIGTMSTVEKTEILIEQFRLNLVERNYIRAEIIGKKIDLKNFDASMDNLRTKYYNLMIRFHSYFNHYFELCRLFRDIYFYHTQSKSGTAVTAGKDAEETKEDDTEMKTDDGALKLEPSDKNQVRIIDDLTNNDLLSLVVLYGILSKYDAEVSDILNRIMLEKNIDKTLKAILQQFLSNEIMKWPFSNESQLQSVLSKTVESGVVDEKGNDSKTRMKYLWEELHTRLTEHNVRVISTYYTDINSQRLAELLAVTPDVSEKIVCQMVQSGQINAKINRTTNVVRFVNNTNNTELLHNLTGDIHQLLNLVDTTNFLIQREAMLYRVKI